MNITGTLEDDGRTLVLRRSFTAPVADVWASVTESDRVARWFGTWTGDPADGFVMVTMNAEAEPGSPTRFDIDTCEPPHTLAVRSTDDFGTWHLGVALVERPDGGTDLTFRQVDVDPGLVPDVGPGWEWYLDRLVAAIDDRTPPTLAAFETDYMALGEAYRELASHFDS